MTRAPRVLVSGVVLGQPMGGVRRHNAELLPRAAALLATAGGGLTVLEGTQPLGFPLPAPAERLTSRVPPGPPIARAIHEGRALAGHLASAAREGRPFDLVHIGHLPAPRGLDVPFTLTLHDLRALTLRHTPFSRRLLAKRVVGGAVARARRVVTVSETVRAELVERFAAAPERVDVVPNAADHLEYAPRRAGKDAALLHVGHLEPRKNLELLLHALQRAPDLPDLCLAGAAKGDEEERLGRLAESLGIRPRVHFLGPVPDDQLVDLYATCGAVVLPSRLEGFGIPAREAMAAGAPLAVSSAGALAEVAPRAPRFDPDDADGCVAAIRRALETGPEDLAQAAQEARGIGWGEAAERLVASWRAAVGGADG